MDRLSLKRLAAKAALEYVEEDSIIGVGTGSTANCFIDALASIKHKIEGAVASSNATEKKLREIGIPIIELNSTAKLGLYVDGADEVGPQLNLIKGGGGALTREKIVAAVANKFVCIIDDTKRVDVLGKSFPLPVEVIPMARSYVAREIVKLGGDPEYRLGFTTDNGNVILDIHNFPIMEPVKMEETLNNITGVVCHGIFAKRHADIVLSASENGVNTLAA